MPRRKAAPAVELRRHPVQDRSIQRVERILNAATAIIEERGLEAVTTNALAAEAELPVGTLYQFFPNREAVLHALLERQLAALDARFGPLITGADAAAPPDEAVGAVIGALAKAYLEIPALATMIQTLRGDPRFDAVAQANNRRIAEWVADLGQRRRPEMPRSHALAVGTAAVEAADGVIMAWLREVHAGRKAAAKLLLGELKRLLVSYLASI